MELAGSVLLKINSQITQIVDCSSTEALEAAEPEPQSAVQPAGSDRLLASPGAAEPVPQPAQPPPCGDGRVGTVAGALCGQQCVDHLAKDSGSLGEPQEAVGTQE